MTQHHNQLLFFSYHSAITATMSTQTRGVTPPPDKVRATAYDVVVDWGQHFGPYGAAFDDDSEIFVTMNPNNGGPNKNAKDKGTAYDIVVSWEDGTGPNGTALDGNPNGGGQRVFPEKETPTGAVKNVVNVVFETVPLNLGHPVTGYYGLLDPDNFIGLGNDSEAADAWKGNDNYWERPSGIEEVKIPKNGVKVETFEIAEAHAGDNWVVVSSASEKRVVQSKMDESSEATRYNVITTAANGEPPANRSEMLTVWRTLWVERDSTVYYPEWPNQTIQFAPAPPPIQLAKTELQRACIELKEYPSVKNPFGAYSNPLDAGSVDLICHGHLTFSSGTLNYPDISGREIPDLAVNKDYWALRIVTTSAHPFDSDAFGVAYGMVNTILIFREALNREVNNWNRDYPNETVGLYESIQRTVLHEICHMLIDEEEDQLDPVIVFDDNGNAVVAQHPAPFGVRDVMGREIGLLQSRIDMKNRIVYNTLVLSDIQEIQKRSEVQESKI